MYDRLSFRVPAVMVSPYAKRNYVSHVTHDHTSVLKLLETKWNLGALTYRDANADNLLDSLNLRARPAFLEPPVLPPPALDVAPDTCTPGDPGRPHPAARCGGADRSQPLADHALVAQRERRTRSAGSWP